MSVSVQAPVDEMAQLRQANAELAQRAAQLQAVVNQRAIPLVATLVDGMNVIVAGARAGDPGSRQLLAELRGALEAVQREGSSIMVPSAPGSRLA